MLLPFIFFFLTYKAQKGEKRLLFLTSTQTQKKKTKQKEKKKKDKYQLIKGD